MAGGEKASVGLRPSAGHKGSAANLNFLYLLAAAAIGFTFAAQPAINGAATRVLGSPIIAAALSVAVTLIACLIAIPFLNVTPTARSFLTLPWWVVFGGLIGVFVVAGGAAIAPVTGAALFFVCFIAGQLVGATLVDHFGAFGMEMRPISLLKLMGVGCAVAGVILVRFG